MDSESCIHQETLYGDDEGPSGRRRYDSYTRKPEWISYGLLALLYVLILVLFITVCSGDDGSSTRKRLVTLKEMNDFRERVHNLSSSMDDLHISLKSKSTSEVTSEKTCELGWKQADDSCYFVTTVTATWSQTRDSCLKKGADLIVITSEREQAFLQFLSNGVSFRNDWIGLHDLEEDGTWTWVDGTNYETGYKHWAKGRPDNRQQAEDCVCLLSSRKWHERPCHYDTNYGVCEKKL